MNRAGQARNLRSRLTDAERVLWRELKGKQIEGCKFRRQCPLGPYIVDFVCLERMLVVEVDGGQHAVRQEEDERRTAWLKRNGYMVLRFWNYEVLQQKDAVLEVIRRTLIDLALRQRPNPGEFAKEAKSADSTKTSAMTSLPPRGRTGGGKSSKVAATYSDHPHPSVHAGHSLSGTLRAASPCKTAVLPFCPPQGEGAGRPQIQWAGEKTAAPTITSPLPAGGGQGEGELNKAAEANSGRPHPSLPPWGEGAEITASNRPEGISCPKDGKGGKASKDQGAH